MATKSKRIFYFDALRALAIISVILIHIYTLTRGYVLSGYGAIPSFEWIYTQFIGNSFRIGVDLFLVLSGALSLGRDWTIKSFLGKRLPRIISPFLFWGIALSIILISLSYFLNYPYIKSFDIMSILTFVYNAFMAKSIGFAPYWFFWMILGTYLIMPIFNKWILHSDLKELEYFLLIWLLTCLFTFTLKTDFPVKLTYFFSPIGLVVLGYYLRYTERKLLNNPYFGIVLIVLSSCLMLFFSYLLSTNHSFYNFDRYSFLTAIEVIGVFILFKNFNKFNLDFLSNENSYLYKVFVDKDSIFKRFAFTLAKYSYGIYLIHTAILSILYRTISISYFSYTSYFLTLFVLDVIISILVMSILSRVPHVKNWIGAK